MARGLAILRSIQRNGLILAPEVVVWTTPVSLGSPSPYRVLQERVCFTELRPDQLSVHSQHFGPYAIEFDIARLRRAGALPVIYMPQALSKDDHLALLGPFVVSHLAHIAHMLGSLNKLNQATDLKHVSERLPGAGAERFADDCVFNLRNSDEQRGIVQEFNVPMTSIRDVLSFLGFENAPFPAMIGAISIVQSLFYPTDDEHVDEPLAYYRQREWRITANYTVNGQPRGLLLPRYQREQLLNVDGRFWKCELQFEDERFRRVDKAVSLALPPPEDVRSMITRVLVPSETVRQPATAKQPVKHHPIVTRSPRHERTLPLQPPTRHYHQPSRHLHILIVALLILIVALQRSNPTRGKMVNVNRKMGWRRPAATKGEVGSHCDWGPQCLCC